MRTKRRLVLLALLCASPALGANVPLAPPRPITEAEREAVRLSAAYLERGPEAIREALSSASPLRRLTAEQANAEIEARAGGRTDVRWELRTPDARAGASVAVFSIESPSGLDDTLVFRMVTEEGVPRVLWLKSFHEAWPDGKSLVVRETPHPPAFSDEALAGIAGAGGLVAALLLLVGVSFLPEKPLPAALWGAAGAAVAALLVLALAGRLPIPGLARGAPQLFATMRRGTDVERVGGLLGVRRSLEAAVPRDAAECLALAKKHPEPMAQLWVAQRLIAVAALPEAKRVLKGLQRPEEVPWDAILRARIAFLEKRDTDAVAAYASAAGRGVLHDGVLLESLAVANALGFDRPDLDLHGKLMTIGARSSEARAILAAGLAQDAHPEDAEAALLSAWRERPLDRETLLSRDELQEILHRPAVLKLLDLASATGTTIGSDEAGRRAIALPPSASARLCGRHLRLIVAGAELHVPGGAALAPAGTAAEDAGAERRGLVERALAQVPRLAADPPPVGAFVQPVLRREILQAAFALARRNRWDEIVAVTARVSGANDQVPPELLMLRAQALRRGGRVDDAKTLLKELAASAAFQRRNDPMALYELGEMFVSLEEFDRGIRCLQAAAARMRRDTLQERIVQVRTEQKLAGRFGSFASAHFDVRFPPERQDGFGREAARVLEAERLRLGRWLAARDDLKTTVQILFFDEFRRTYGSGGDVLGLFDGKIRVPLASVGRFGPFVVSIVTHELSHALVADLTKDNAPRWFQEGLAQHLEMRRFRPNYIMQYQAQGALLSLPMVEAVLERFPDPYFVEQAYQESEWAVAYIDTKWGAEGLKRLMSAYRDGLFGDGALRKALGVDTAALSRDFVAWSLKQPKMLHDEIVAYDDTPDEGFHWSRDPNEPLGRTKPAEIPESLQ